MYYTQEQRAARLAVIEGIERRALDRNRLRDATEAAARKISKARPMPFEQFWRAVVREFGRIPEEVGLDELRREILAALRSLEYHAIVKLTGPGRSPKVHFTGGF